MIACICFAKKQIIGVDVKGRTEPDDVFRAQCFFAKFRRGNDSESMEGNGAGMGGISGKTACRRTGKGRRNERVPGGFCVCTGEACLYPGLCRLCAGTVSYGAFEGERRAKVDGEAECTVATECLVRCGTGGSTFSSLFNMSVLYNHLSDFGEKICKSGILSVLSRKTFDIIYHRNNSILC